MTFLHCYSPLGLSPLGLLIECFYPCPKKQNKITVSVSFFGLSPSQFDFLDCFLVQVGLVFLLGSWLGPV